MKWFSQNFESATITKNTLKLVRKKTFSHRKYYKKHRLSLKILLISATQISLLKLQNFIFKKSVESTAIKKRHIESIMVQQDVFSKKKYRQTAQKIVSGVFVYVSRTSVAWKFYEIYLQKKLFLFFIFIFEHSVSLNYEITQPSKN